MHHRRGSLYARLLCGAAFIGLGFASAASAEEAIKFDIKPQTLTSALNEFGVQSQTAVLFRADVAKAKVTQGLVGTAEPEAALQTMLAGTELSYRREGSAFVIVQQEGGTSPQDASAGDVDALIVTAQKKEEAIQDVPIAISAFTQKSLDAQKIEGGFDLLKAIPNVTFSKSNFSGYNFSIRGVGTKAVSASTDPGVAVAYNNTTLIVNRLFEQEYFDVERVEVLRGPQGTLYGRNATSGVINVLSARPRLGEFAGDLKVELGNYNAQRARGMVNIPIGDTLAIRAAGALTKRDGFGTNLAASDPTVLNPELREDVDGRDLWSARVTVGWEPIEQIRVNAMWERFEEDDNRVRTSKQLCHYDPGPANLGSFEWTEGERLQLRSVTSQGCLPGSLYDEGAFGTPNGASLPYVNAINWVSTLGGIGRKPTSIPGYNPWYPGNSSDPAPCADAAGWYTFVFINACQPDPYGGLTQSRNLRAIYSTIEPTYRAKSDIFELSIDVDLTDNLTFTSQTLYTTDKYYASQDYNRFTSVPIFNDSSRACGAVELFPGFLSPDCSEAARGTFFGGLWNLTPGGVFTDPQLGPSSSLLAQDLSEVESDQFNQEFRLVSNFDAPFNFSMGANFTRFETYNDYFVFINALSLISQVFPFVTPDINCDYTGPIENVDTRCIYIDRNPLASIDGDGHNYFRSANPYELTSSAMFGELYWQATDTVKVTLGARMTWDRKVFTPVPSQLLLHDYRAHVQPGEGPDRCLTAQDTCTISGTGLYGKGSVPEPDIVQEWREPTGRIIVDWKPDLDFTDETMVYGSISHGYKGGGANPPNISYPAGRFNQRNSGVVSPPTFAPEFVNAFEVGTKNTLLGGSLILNGSAFFYDYEGYQVSKIVDRSASNENFDARIWGAELEWIYSPMRNLRFNGAFGALRTELGENQRSIDLMDRTQGGSHSSYFDAEGVEHPLAFDQWMTLKPYVAYSSNCVIPVDVAEDALLRGDGTSVGKLYDGLCPGRGTTYTLLDGRQFLSSLDSPNGGAGFFADVGGNELPNAPHWTASLGAQYRMALPGGWDATLRGDFYWQSQSFARVYNTQYDKLRAWTNTNISLWVENPDWGVTAEVYVKNAFDETPITDAFLNSDDSGLTTNVFTLDPRVVGVSVRKQF